MSFTRGLACWTSIREISFRILWAASIMATIISLPPSQSLNTIWAPISPPLMEFREIRKTAQSMVMLMSGAGAFLWQTLCVCQDLVAFFFQVLVALDYKMLQPRWRMACRMSPMVRWFISCWKCRRLQCQQKWGEPPLLDTSNHAAGSAPRCRTEKKGANYLGQELLRGY